MSDGLETRGMSWSRPPTAQHEVTSPFLMDISPAPFSSPPPFSPYINVSELSEPSPSPPPGRALLYWYAINGVCGSAIGAVGVAGNCLSVCVLTQRCMRNSTSVLLICMALFDNVFLLLSLLLQTLPFVFITHDVFPQYITVRQALFKGFYAVVHMAHTGTIYMTVAVTVERAMVVTRPLRAKSLCTRRRAGLVALGVALWSVIYNIPRCLEYDTPRLVTRPAGANSTAAELVSVKTAFGHSTFYNRYYLVYLNSLFHFLLPFLVVCTLNALIILRLLHRPPLPTHQRRGLQADSESRLTAMVLALTAVFCVCHVLAAAELIVVQLEKGYTARLGGCSLPCEAFSAFAETMTIVNSASNFLLYSIFGQKFRRACCRSLCCVAVKGPPPGSAGHRSCHSLLTSSYRGHAVQLRLTPSLDN